MNSTTVSAELGLRLVVPDRTTVPLLAGLSYTADDPYAIRMAFHVGNDEPVEWIFARELLTVGIVRRVGDGDVQVWPARADGERTLHISLTSPFGQALFEVPLAPLTEFLHRTYEVVPAGRDILAISMLWPAYMSLAMTRIRWSLPSASSSSAILSAPSWCLIMSCRNRRSKALPLLARRALICASVAMP